MGSSVVVILGIALRNLVQAWRRTVLLTAAIGVVTSMLVLLQALAAGIEASLIDAATTVSAGHVNVAGFWKPTATTASPFLTDRDAVRKIVEENTPGLDYMVERHRGWAKIVSDSSSTYAGLNGLEAEQEGRFFDTVRLAKESAWMEGGADVVRGNPRDLARPHTIMLFASQAKRLEVTVGDAVTLQTENPGGQTNTLDATVVAVAEDMGLLSSWAVFVPADDVREIYGIAENTTGALWLYLDDIDQAPQVMNHLREVFLAQGYEVMDHQAAPFFMKFDVAGGEDWTGFKLDLTTWEDEVSFISWILTAFRAVTLLLVLILVSIVAVGIMNTMWNAVRDRTAEIGTMRAIGMRRGKVLALILSEALLLGLLATGLGAAVGAAVAFGVDAAQVPVEIDAVKAILLSDKLRLTVRGGSVFGSVALLSFLTVVASLWPAWRASRLPPVTAIQHVE